MVLCLFLMFSWHNFKYWNRWNWMIENNSIVTTIYVHLWLNCSFDKILVAWKQTEDGLCHVTKHTRNPHASSTADGKERCPKGVYIVHSTVLIFKSDIDYLNLKKKSIVKMRSTV